MKAVVNDRTATAQSKLERVLDLLPERIRQAAGAYSPINEIRLRTDRPVSFNVGGHNVVTGIITGADELDCIVGLLCGGSLHAHERSIAEGYIDYMGCRVGVCGTRHINSLNIRIPRFIRGVGGALLSRLAAVDFKCGALVYSPPGIGKTTLLRDLAASASSPPYNKRVTVIDTRGELYDADMMRGCTIDVLDGVTKAAGIEIATRTLSPELIVCDEIGSREEAVAIMSAQNAGVPLLASAHAVSAEGLLRRPALRMLAEAAVFELYCGIGRHGSDERFIFDIRTRGELLC